MVLGYWLVETPYYARLTTVQRTLIFLLTLVDVLVLFLQQKPFQQQIFGW
jgi:hypothetical protein